MSHLIGHVLSRGLEEYTGMPSGGRGQSWVNSGTSQRLSFKGDGGGLGGGEDNV